MGLFVTLAAVKTSIMDMAKDAKEPAQSVQVFGRKKTATAVAYCKRGKGLVRVNGKPLEQVEPKPLQFKLQEPILLLGKDRFAEVDIRIRVKGVSELHKSTLSDKPCPRPLSPIIKNSLTNKAKRPSKTCWSNTTEPYWS